MERVIAAASYFTAGIVGLLWLILTAFLKKSSTFFLLFHIQQSIFLGFSFYLIFQLYKLLFIVLVKIPLINSIVLFFNSILFNPLPFMWGMSLVQIFTTTLLIYLIMTSLLGLYSYVPYVSDIIKQNLGLK